MRETSATVPASEALRAAVSSLAAAGIVSPAREARLLLAEALGVRQEALLGGTLALAPDAAARFSALLARRVAREPLSHILGRREFWSLDFGIGPEVLTPRPESEHVVEAALAHARRAGAGAPRILDLGTGSGCLLIALLHELPAAEGVGIDRSRAALSRARANARACGVAARARFLCGDWLAPLSGAFDLIVANPPYLAAAEIAGLMPEVRAYEPHLALDGGPDGLAAYRRLLPQIAPFLAPGGTLHLEIGAGQGAAVVALAEAAGLCLLEVRPDLAGIARVLSLAAEKGLGDLPAAE